MCVQQTYASNRMVKLRFKMKTHKETRPRVLEDTLMVIQRQKRDESNRLISSPKNSSCTIVLFIFIWTSTGVLTF